MRTTVEIPDDLYRQAESKAAREGIPVGDLIAQGLRLALGKSPLPKGRRISFPLHHSNHPGALSVETVRAAQQAAANQEDAARGSPV